MKSPARASYRLGTYYRAHDEHGPPHRLPSSEEYRHMKRSYVRECGRDKRGGGDDGDGSDYKLLSWILYEWINLCGNRYVFIVNDV